MSLGEQRAAGAAEPTEVEVPPGGWFSSRLRTAGQLAPFPCGLAAISIGLRAQLLLTPDGFPALSADTVAATRWYILAVGIVLIGWSEGYRNYSYLRPFHRASLRSLLATERMQFRLMLAGLALVANLSALLALSRNWYSPIGFGLWVVSLALVIVAARGAAPRGETPDVPRDRRQSPRWLEVAAFTSIVALALMMRLWRLGDLAPGMHGDEGEAGADALGILNGVPTSPFLRGWFNNPNMYFWALALTMKLFGTNLFGLRMFAVICGLVTVVFVYLIAREMFGLQGAIAAGFLMAFQSADLLFSRMELSNAPIPALTAASFYFLLRGLRAGRYLDFVLGGMTAGFDAYFYAGGRLTGPVAVLFLLFVAALHPRLARSYWPQCLAFLFALLLVSTPSIGSLIAYPIHSTDYPNNRFIWLHHSDLAALYGTNSWPAILWNQLQRTLSIITYNPDVSANGILNYPIARPLEAALIILGLVWAAWRWRDTRFALVNVWFWTAIIAGGVLTTEAPNLPRIVAILPVLPLLMAGVLDHLAEQLVGLTGRFSRPRYRAVGQRLGLAVVGSAVLTAGIHNWQTYVGYYLNTHQNPVVTGQAQYVRREGYRYAYLDLGAPDVYWTHGDNKFINRGASGRDMLNPASDLPITYNAGRPVILLDWFPMYTYRPVLQRIYPNGTTQVIPLGDKTDPASPLDTVIESQRQLDAYRVVSATYRSVSGATVTRHEPALGLPPRALPPSGLRYPVTATWRGDLFAPLYGVFWLRVAGGAGARLTIDGVAVGGPGRLMMARGLHAVRLTARLGSASSRPYLAWARGKSRLEPVPRQFLWDGHVGPAWAGTIRRFPDPQTGMLTPPPVHRTDSILAFRDVQRAFGPTSAVDARWGSRLRVQRAGTYRFGFRAVGDAELRVDGQVAVRDAGRDPNLPLLSRPVQLSAGTHRLEVRYQWQSFEGTGELELWWRPPGGQDGIMLSGHLSPAVPGIFPYHPARKASGHR